MYVSDMELSLLPIELLVAHKTYCAPDWRWVNPSGDVDTLNLWCVVSGRGTLTSATGSYPLREGDCFVIRMWDYCRGEHDPDHPLVVLWAIYRYPHLSGRPAESVLPREYRHLTNVPFFSQLFERAISAFNAEGAARLHAVPWMSAALVALAEEDRLSPGDAFECEQIDLIRQICARIKAEPAQHVSVAALAEECRYSPRHFARVFHRVTGYAPRDFFVQTRIDAAKSLLCISNYSISRIAEMLGYRDVFHFSRQFRQRTGMSPSDFRRP